MKKLIIKKLRKKFVDQKKLNEIDLEQDTVNETLIYIDQEIKRKKIDQIRL